MAHLLSPVGLLDWIVPAISDASQRPTDWPITSGKVWFDRLLYFALLPLIWFNLGAIVCGNNLNKMTDSTSRVTNKATKYWSAIPKPITGFFGHLWLGVLKRWYAIVNGILLAASAGTWLTVSIIISWRLADWIGRWL